VPVLFRTGSALGIHPSECSPLERYPRYYHSDDPTYRLTCRCSRRRSAGPAQQASVPGIQPFRESLAVGRGFSSPSAGYSPGFSPLQGIATRLVPAFARTPPSRFSVQNDESPCPLAPRSFSQRATGSIHSRHLTAPQTDQTTLLGFLHLPDPERSDEDTPWLCVHLTWPPTLLRSHP
jgi:hypothetical protein